MADPYLDPDSGVLRNRLGLTNRHSLAAAEGDLVFRRAVTRVSGTTFGFSHLCEIHRWLFQDVFDWAGVPRTTEMRKGSTEFWPAELIARRATKVLERLQSSPLLTEPETDAEEFLSGICDLYLDLNQLHPFREGNGRTQRAFLNDVAGRSQRFIDWRVVSRADNDEASQEAVLLQSHRPFVDLLRHSIRDLDGMASRASVLTVDLAPMPGEGPSD